MYIYGLLRTEILRKRLLPMLKILPGRLTELCGYGVLESCRTQIQLSGVIFSSLPSGPLHPLCVQPSILVTSP